MNNEIAITVPGKPMSKLRADMGGGKHFTATRTGNWEAAAGLRASSVMKSRAPLTGPLCCRVTAYFPISDSWPDWKKAAARDGTLRHTAVPDASNLLKAAEDALNGIVWKDDRQLVITSAEKQFSDQPRVEILVFPAAGVSSNITRRDQLPS